MPITKSTRPNRQQLSKKHGLTGERYLHSIRDLCLHIAQINQEDLEFSTYGVPEGAHVTGGRTFRDE